MRTEIELNQIIAMLSSDIMDRIYMDMLSIPDNSDSIAVEQHIDIVV